MNSNLKIFFQPEERYFLPNKIDEHLLILIEKELQSRSIPFKKIEKEILEQSDRFNQDALKKAVKTKYGQNGDLAYLSYFFPLNFIRNLSVFLEIEKTWATAKQILDVTEWGSGPGTVHLAALSTNLNLKNWNAIEIDSSSREWHRYFVKNFFPNHLKNLRFESQREETKKNQSEALRLGVFSYSLNEIGALPKAAFDQDALLIIEPSGQKNSRALMKLRKELIKKSWFIEAPCPHQKACPLLEESVRDFCHHRILIEPPKVFNLLSRDFPIRNRNLTYSYLFATRKPPNTEEKDTEKDQVRFIGDSLKEKGKTRQAICRSSKREFFAQLKKSGPEIPIRRGSLVQFPDDIQIKGNEIRLQPGEKK